PGPEHDGVAAHVGRALERGRGRSRRRPGGRGARRSGGRRARLGRRSAVCGFEHEDARVLRYLVADLDAQLLHAARRGRRDLHRRLVGLERDERGFLLDAVARLDQHLDHVDVLEVADVGNADLDDAHFTPRASLIVCSSKGALELLSNSMPALTPARAISVALFASSEIAYMAPSAK